MTNMFQILAPGHINFSETVVFCFIMVATVREKSGNFLRSRGKSLVLSNSVKGQGILFSGL